MSKKITDAIQEMKDQAERAVSDIAVAADPALTAVKAELAAAEKQAAPTVKRATAAVADELQQAKIKTEPYVKQARRKAEPAIRTAQAAAKKAEPTLKAAKDAGTQLAHVLVPEVYVQLGEHQFTCTDIVERCRADFRAANKGGIHSCKVYIKPEDGMAYYVINRIEGKIKLN